MRLTGLNAASTSGDAASSQDGDRVQLLEPALWKQLGEATDFPAFSQIWLALQCGLIGNVTGGVVVAVQDAQATPVAIWPQSWDFTSLSSVIQPAAAQRRGVVRYDPVSTESTAEAHAGLTASLAFPILIGDDIRGIAAVELKNVSEPQTRAAMRQLQWGAAGLREYLLRQGRLDTSRQARQSQSALDILSVTLEQEGFDTACRSLVTELAVRFGCERVSVGMVRGGHAKVVAISHSAQFGREMNLVRLVGGAMDEALDQHALIRYPAASDELNVTRAHAELAQSGGAASLLTIPMFIKDRFIGAITFEHPNGFDADTITVLDCVAATAAPILEEKRRNDRWLIVKAAESLWSQFEHLLGPGYAKRKLTVLLLLAATAGGYFWHGLYRVTTEALIEGQIQRSVVAPFNGFVLEAPVRAGDTVKSGQLLARLDDRDLLLERLKWLTERQRRKLEFEKAMGERNRSEQQISTTQVEQAEAQIRLVDEQLTRASLVAPFDGLVISGDLTQSIGASLQRGQEMFQIAPLDSYRVVLDVDETQIGDIAIGQKGLLVVSSLPGEEFALAVTKITPVSKAHDGHNTFRVEGQLETAALALRPGMHGVAKIDIDRRRMVWIWARSFLDWARLTLWRWFS
ncbi:efflux RND transporter periplasmic adaptor subunit [Bradyrhizobium sp. dw_411]|uniref:efflux RND transporter periplasmic adaptor subunit n=1 Tax=Bradyrhizobium sp. dw_411 TaxID=2720082 RepID=UPI001BCFCD49|nr:efflux RND transporter periplasmic adaptor subunit [Bradyrhizobium sp. dw_411]